MERSPHAPFGWKYESVESETTFVWLENKKRALWISIVIRKHVYGWMWMDHNLCSTMLNKKAGQWIIKI